MEENKKKQKKKKVLLLLFLLLIAAGITVFAVTILTGDGKAGNSSKNHLVENGSALHGGYAQKSRQEILDELRKKQIKVTDNISSQITFSDGTRGTKGSWIVENPGTNTVIEQCELIIHGKKVATSVPIQPGQHIENISLSSDVKSGTYNVTAVISYYNCKTKSYLGRAGYQNIKMLIS